MLWNFFWILGANWNAASTYFSFLQILRIGAKILSYFHLSIMWKLHRCIKTWKLIKKHMKAQDVFWKLISTIQGVSSVTLQPFQKVKWLESMFPFTLQDSIKMLCEKATDDWALQRVKLISVVNKRLKQLGFSGIFWKWNLHQRWLQ